MKKTIFWMVATFFVAFAWLSYWVDTELGDARFLIGWSGYFAWCAYWFNCKKGKRVIDYICDEILK